MTLASGTRRLLRKFSGPQPSDNFDPAVRSALTHWCAGPKTAGEIDELQFPNYRHEPHILPGCSCHRSVINVKHAS